MGLEGLVTVEKIRAAINASLSGLSNSDATITITKNDGTTSTITINNVANATTATKLGSSTVGSGVKAIYLNAGTATASNSTVGNSNTPVYLNNGTFTACSSNIGSGWTVSNGTNGWARENSTGLTVQWGYVNRSNSLTGTFTFPRTFTTCYYSNVMCSSNLVPYIKARSNTSITFNTNNGYNDDIQNLGNCYIFAIGVS